MKARATKLGWVVQIEQPAAAARWVFGLGMRQLMVTWVLGSKMGLSCMGVGSDVTVWVAASWLHSVRSKMGLSLSQSRLSLSFLFFFFLHFWLFHLVLESYWLLGFLLLFILFLIFFKGFHGLLKTLGLVGWDRDGWGEGGLS